MSSLTSFLLLVPSLIKEHPSVKRHAQLIKVKSLCLRQEIILLQVRHVIVQQCALLFDQ